MKIKKIIPSLLALAVIPAFAAATDATPKRVGPVSYYGALHTSGGKIIGAKNNQEAVLRGMSLFWSDATGRPYYNKNVISWAAQNLPMDVFRFAMGITYYDSDGGTTNKLDGSYAYSSAPEGYAGIIDKMVEAAIENDIYIILDWHSHRADKNEGGVNEPQLAKDFFTQMAAKYKDVPNVIFEIFNEPRQNQDWGSIKSYANPVVSGIRASTENLVLVGTPSWSQLDQYGGVSGTNVGYVFHFYAGTHSTGTFSSRITQAKSSGNPVFITEWGTVNADGAGNADQGSTSSWMTFMDNNNISNCNWSLRNTKSRYATDGKVETSAMFDGEEDLNTVGKLNNATYSASGKLVKAYLEKHARTWGDSLVKGKNSGNCAFPTTNVKETDGQLSVLKSGCTYVSSNENVVTSTGEIKKPGFVIMTDNNGSQSVVVVNEVPKQTIPFFTDLTCNYSGACSIERALSYSGGTAKEWIVSGTTKTEEGGTFTITSLNPEIVTVKKANCTSSSCFKMQNTQVTMYEFKGYGTAKVVATAPAVTGYPALNDTVEVTFNKGFNKMTNKYKDIALKLGETKSGYLPDQSLYKTPVTYTFNDKETSNYVSKNGTDLVAGNENAVVLVTAHAPEVDNYLEMHSAITVIVGDSSQAVNKSEYQTSPVIVTNPDLPLQAVIANNMLGINSVNTEDIHVDVFSVNGQSVLSKTLSAKHATLSLASVPTGAYLITIKQGMRILSVRWSKK